MKSVTRIVRTDKCRVYPIKSVFGKELTNSMILKLGLISWTTNMVIDISSDVNSFLKYIE